MIIAEHLFDKYAFRKCLPEHLQPTAKQQLINRSMFTVLGVLLAERDFQEVKAKIPRGKMAELLAHELEKDNDLLNCLTHKTNDEKVLEETFKKLESFLSKTFRSN